MFPWLTKSRGTMVGLFLLGAVTGAAIDNGHVTSSVVEAKDAQIAQKDVTIKKQAEVVKKVVAVGNCQQVRADTATAAAYGDVGAAAAIPNCPPVASVAKVK